jgi:hypothetical protein
MVKTMSDSKQAIEVINAICEKVGIVCNSAQEFIPKLVQHNIVSGGIGMIVSATIATVGAILILRGKKIKAENEYADFEPYFVAGGFLVVASSIMFLVCLYSVIMWAMFPDVEAVTYILNAIGG